MNRNGSDGLLFRLALAAVAGLSACSDDDRTANLPLPDDVTGPGSQRTLRQSATLTGPYAKGIRIVGEGLQPTGPGQVITLTFELDEAAQVRQFDFTVEADPPSAFDVAAAEATVDAPFVTPVPNGVQIVAGTMRIIGASLSNAATGTHAMATLKLRTAQGFGAFTRARLEVTELSIGPSSSQRDRYDAATLRLGVDFD